MRRTPPAGTGDTGGTGDGGISAGSGSGAGRGDGAAATCPSRSGDPVATEDGAGAADHVYRAYLNPVTADGGALERRSADTPLSAGADPDGRVDLAALAGPGARSAADDDQDDYDPGWLGTVLRWPVRIVAVVLIVPVQVAWQSAKAAGTAAGRTLARFGRGIARAADRVVGRPLRWAGRRVAAGIEAVARGVGWAAARVLWWPVRWAGRGTGRVGRWVYRKVLRPIGSGVGWVVRGIGRGFSLAGAGVAFVARAAAGAVLFVLRPVGRALRDGIRAVSGAAYRTVLRPLGRGVAAVVVGIGRGVRVAAPVLGRGIVWLATGLFHPVRLLGRGLWFVLRTLGRWIAGLGHVIGEALAFGWRVGGAVGRGFVWLWVTTVWNPAKWVGRGLRTAWLSVWRPVAAATRRAVAPFATAARNVRRWYRHEISEPIRSALSAARRDVRRALSGRRKT